MKYILYLLVFSIVLLISMEQKNSCVDSTGEVVSYYCDLEKTESENDEYQAMFAPESLFMQLVVQASKSPRENKKPFQELLQRIGKEVKIQQPNVYVGMTFKDGNHRLLSYIPKIKEPSANIIVNGKKADLDFIQQTCFEKGKMKAEDIFMVEYNFESDKEHHAKVVKEYNELLYKNLKP